MLPWGWLDPAVEVPGERVVFGDAAEYADAVDTAGKLSAAVSSVAAAVEAPTVWVWAGVSEISRVWIASPPVAPKG